jgi:uridine kinase
MRARLVEEVAAQVAALPARALVAVDGPDGAGKTHFAGELAAAVALSRPVLRASLDDFHHPRAFRHAEGRTPETVWSRHFDLEALTRELLDPWRAGRPVRLRWHDLDSDQRVDSASEHVPPDAVLLVDGVFLQREELAGAWDLTVYLDVPDDLGLARVEQRDGPLDDPARYAGAQRLYRERRSPARRADLVIDNRDLEHPQYVMRIEG